MKNHAYTEDFRTKLRWCSDIYNRVAIYIANYQVITNHNNQ